MEHICCNCRHFRTMEMIGESGLRYEQGYCKASWNYAEHKPTDTCKRYHFKEEKIYEF